MATEVIDVIRAAKATGLRVSLLPGILATVGSSVVFDDLGGIVLLGRAALRALAILGARQAIASTSLPRAFC